MCVYVNAAVPFKTRRGLPSKYVIAQCKELVFTDTCTVYKLARQRQLRQHSRQEKFSGREPVEVPLSVDNRLEVDEPS